MTALDIQKRLRSFASKEKAKVLQGFFKTGPGEYGEGDRFLGIAVPAVRKVAREFQGASLDVIATLLASAYHEERLLALLMLVDAYAKGDAPRKRELYGFYRRQMTHINNWDLVDLSAPRIIGAYLRDRSRKPLYRLAKSRDLWRRRIAILATFAFIKHGDFEDSLAIAERLLLDDHDLIHKAVGWMLREVGKRDRHALERFLSSHSRTMPRTMLRYAIERFPREKRLRYLKGEVVPKTGAA